jgi:hypothetical protein
MLNGLEPSTFGWIIFGSLAIVKPLVPDGLHEEAVKGKVLDAGSNRFRNLPWGEGIARARL